MLCKLHLNKNCPPPKSILLLGCPSHAHRSPQSHLPHHRLALRWPTRTEARPHPLAWLTHPLTSRRRVPLNPGCGGRLSRPRHSACTAGALFCPAPTGGGEAAPKAALTRGWRPRPASRVARPGGGATAHLPQPAGRSAFSARTDGWVTAGTRRASVTAAAGVAHAASSLHVSHVSTAPAPRLGSGPGSVKAEARRRGLKREASGERRWGPNGPARASWRSRGCCARASGKRSPELGALGVSPPA